MNEALMHNLHMQTNRKDKPDKTYILMWKEVNF